jgi:hypothetical protein
MSLPKLALAALVLVSPLPVAAWQGGASGRIGYTADATDETRAEAAFVARVDGGGLTLIVTVDVPGEAGDAVLSFDVPPEQARGRMFTLPARGVRVVYLEYDGEGRVVFRAAQSAGTVRFALGSSRLDVALNVVFEDETGARRRLQGGRAELPQDVDSPEAVRAREEAETQGDGPYVLYVDDHGDQGCGAQDDPEDWRDDPQSDTSGYGAGDSSTGGGCAGDDFGSGAEDPAESSGDSGGGCEGDDVDSDTDTSGSGCDDGCAGDGLAEASLLGRRPSRSKVDVWVARCVSWTPWWLALLAVRVMRGASRRRVWAP